MTSKHALGITQTETAQTTETVPTIDRRASCPRGGYRRPRSPPPMEGPFHGNET